MRWRSLRSAERLLEYVQLSRAKPLALKQLTAIFQVWGITIGTTVLQTQLTQRLPSDFTSQVPGGISLAYALIPIIPTLEEPFKTEVRTAFAESIKVIWEVMIGIAGMGLLASLFMKGLPLHTEVDRQWALQVEKPEDSQKQQMEGELLPLPAISSNQASL